MNVRVAPREEARGPSVSEIRAGPPFATSHRQVRWAVVKIALVLVLPLAGGAAHAAVFVLLAIWALPGPRHAVEALTLSWLASFLNPGLYAQSGSAVALRWLVLGAALLSVAVHCARFGFTVPRAWFGILAFVLTAAVLASFVSYAVDVSLFKLIGFLMGTTAVLWAFGLTRREAAYWQRWFLALFAVVVVASFPLIAHPLGYVRNGRGFQGLLNHPQTYTIFIGPLLAWHAARLITHEIRGSWMWTIAGVAAVSLVATKGRTGLLAAMGGLAIASLWWLASGRVRRSIPRVWFAAALTLSAVGAGWAAFHWGAVSTAVARFAVKGQVGSSVGESFYASRGALLESSLANFRRYPVTGIGFGVASDPAAFTIQRDPLFGLPVSAATEKGFSLVALLEEVGLVGFTVFLIMLALVLRPVLGTRASFPAAVLALSALMVNFGEAVFFAIAGSGMLIWLLIGLAVVTAARGRMPVFGSDD